MTTEELLLKAAESCSIADLNALLKALREHNNTRDLSEFADSLQLLWENFPEELEIEHAQFCLEVAKLRIPDNAVFRQVLAAAIKTTLPPYLCKLGVLRAIGLRDNSVHPGEVLRRIERLMAIKSGIITYIFDSGKWGMVTNIDALNAQVAINLSEGGAQGIPLEKMLTRGYFFKNSVATNKLSMPAKLLQISGADFRNIVAAECVAHLSEGAVRAMAERLLVPQTLNAEAFEAWYNSSSAPKPAAAAVKRCAASARSLKEMDLLLDEELKAKLNTVDEAMVESFAKFFTNLKADVAAREAKMLCTIIAKIADRVPASEWENVLAPLKGKAPFWPLDPVAAKLENLEVWGTLAVKFSGKLAKVTTVVFDDEYLTYLAVRLPLKSINVCAEQLDAELLDLVFANPPLMTADLLLWAWKNRKKHPALEVLIKLENVVLALNYSRLPKEWGAAQRELHTILLDKEDFQKYIVQTAGSDIPALVAALAGASTFTTGERQSLLVKLSRYSTAIKEHLEAGAGSKLLGANQEDAPAVEEAIYTSLASHRRMVQELQDIINIHQPENREALKTARAHGDFRENAEFDAAKERRNFLTRRRNELERDLARVNALDFATIKPTGYVDLGTTVTLEIAGAADEVYYYLGAWDGDPEKNYLSYKTKLGEVLRHHQLGDAVTLPDNRSAKIKAIEALPEAVLADMA
ncbi:MAG: GreA/GreB family elongation factor [Lentisphaeria bacterium]|nr:GreA/GreB family elongation factor [Lentisphaeria bacterium]